MPQFSTSNRKLVSAFRTIMDDYLTTDGPIMSEALFSYSADGLSIGEAFELYVSLCNHCLGDKFFRVIGEELDELDLSQLPTSTCEMDCLVQE